MNEHLTAAWDCQAYGPEGVTVGALCFFADLNKRTCRNEAECRDRLAGERRRLFRAINEMAAGGNEAGRFLADEITNPGQLLGGDEARP